MSSRDGLRLWWLIRKEGKDKSYVLSAYVITDRDAESEAPTVESTILGLEDRLFGSGETAREAELNAMQLLHDMLEDALASGTLEESFKDAKGLGVKLAAVPFEKMVEMMEEFRDTAAGKPATSKRLSLSDAGWRAEPATPELAEVC
jgi:hypothetical protein